MSLICAVAWTVRIVPTVLFGVLIGYWLFIFYKSCRTLTMNEFLGYCIMWLAVILIISGGLVVGFAADDWATRVLKTCPEHAK